MDKSINSYGRKLIELCKNNKMIILNGRENSERGDISDGFTSFKYNGSSTVDYTVAECGELKYIKHFSALEKQVDSDHSPLSFTLEIKTDINDPRKSYQCNTLENYKWDPNNKFHYINSIASEQSRESFSDFLCDNVDTNLDLNEVVECFYDFVEESQKDNFRKCGRSTTSSFPWNAWFDNECKELKRALRNEEKQGKNVRGSRQIRRMYKGLIQKKKRRYMNNIAHEVDEMFSNHQSDYWKFWKRHW